jgi:hypothetical protein
MNDPGGVNVTFVRGERHAAYTQITMRLPDSTKRLLDAITGMTGWPAWRVFDRSLAAFVRELSAEDRHVLEVVKARRAKRD